MPPCDHTGTPSGLDALTHLHSSIIVGSASRISARMRARVSPRQPPRSLMRCSIMRDADTVLTAAGVEAAAGLRKVRAPAASLALGFALLVAGLGRVGMARMIAHASTPRSRARPAVY